MKYTKEQLQRMSDFDVNLALAILCGVDHYVASGILYTQVKHDGINVTSISGQTNYCNNPSDIMPMAFEHGIVLKCSRCPAGSGYAYYAESYDTAINTDYMNPLRAIACCLILVLQDKQ